MYKLLFFTVVLQFALNAAASPDTTEQPKRHYLFNKQIDEAQAKTDLLDKKKDGSLNLTKNEEINLQIAHAVFRKVDLLQLKIENNPKLKTPNEQIRYLVNLKNLLLYYNAAVGTSINRRQFDPLLTPQLITQYEKAMNLEIDSMSILPAIEHSPYPVAKIISDILNSGKNMSEVKKVVYLKFCEQYPAKILESLEPYAQEPFADSLLSEVARRNPSQLYNYAASKTRPVGKRIHACNDPLVKTIAQLSLTDNALLYFPFLDGLMKGNIAADSIRKFVGDGEKSYDSVGYFKLLVKTEIAYAKRLQAKDTPVAMFGANGLRDMLRRKDSTHFINWINAMHNDPEPRRMKPVDPLSSVDLYYAIVLGEEDIYTSSYKHCFTRLIQRLGPKPRTDSLLEIVGYDYFKKFIKMAANFNRLDTFLKLMPPDKAVQVMKSFVSGLENTGNLEDAVDVADSYSSIKDKNLQKNILSYIKENEIKAEAKEDERGKTIYSLLKTIFLSTDTNLKPRVDLTQAFGIPSIYEVENKYLRTDSIIAEQMFFYGDEDGKTGYNGFINGFDWKVWKKVQKPEWVEISPVKNPNRFTIYANLPLNNDKNLDDTAQVHLNEYLRLKKIEPSIVVHRGHSYWLPRTISRMPDDAKIIILGSCGGYKNLGPIIKTSPGAHIISTKQIGMGNINGPILRYLHGEVINGKTISWPVMWAALTKTFAAGKNKTFIEAWEDYIPPYNNLGAIFLKAYSKKIQ